MRTLGECFPSYAEAQLGRFFEFLGSDQASFEEALRRFIHFTYDVIRMQSRFQRGGPVSPFPPESHRQQVHDNASLMQESYLLGLYLASVFWPNHVEQVKYYGERFGALSGRLLPARKAPERSYSSQAISSS
jgi:hypothetical protein